MLTARNPHRGESGIVGANLVAVIAFALFAVIVLARTVISAQDINHQVAVIIRPEIGQVNVSLKTLPVLNQVNATAAQIMTAAKPLSGQAGQIVDATQTIMGTVHTINGAANSINASVHSIGSDVTSVSGAVGSISSSVNNISGKVGGISGTVNAIQRNVGAISGDTGSINSSAKNIQGNLGGIMSTAADIRGNQTAGLIAGAAGNGVAGIDNRAETVIGQVGSGQPNTIKAATTAINAAIPPITNNASHICTSPVFQGQVQPLSILKLPLLSLLGVGPANCP
ncbi:MAG: hypothetical protein DLM54_11350 [Acidimicrobiales bacterium]|nr:MAG: hypothetical protein DLM54_11350 [Acidimicrobiales bacterium]